ncbi:M3 family metallopeptidase [Paenalcaligenes niemegkensis]|uniref:M3 family metallopeptidase n=1 Tax=Paenalcaligenes niemegkensis TaxID=2895469 RepID=UPI001EE83BE7|nr:M3 family metallopeptidase [Paenalcaligenes niemegkensis]MCQ9616273.1 M3 family metallopeptidase [Paenalcaligenes niemegkensis]
MSNPLLTPIDQLVAYADIKAEHVAPAIEQLLDQAKVAVDQIAHQPHSTWDSVVAALDDATEELWRSWTIVGHLNSVINTPELRDAYNDCLPKVTEFSTWVGLNEALYRHYKALVASPEYETLKPVQQRVLNLALRDFRLSGVELQGNDRERYAELSEQQAAASQRFSENVLDSIDSWTLLVEDHGTLKGIPEDVQNAARDAAEAAGKKGWLLNLKMPCYLPVMQYAESSELRAQLYKAYATVASDQADKPKLDNSASIEELLSLRAEEAQLLGFASYAHMRLETRMADSPEQVLAFLRTLASKAISFAQADLTQLREFAQKQLGIADLQPWDMAFAAERLRQERYAYSEDEVKQYFTEPQVLNGLFHVVNRLFNVSFEATTASVWHPSVTAYDVKDPTGKTLGHLYIDLYARTGKQGGAWVNGERSRRLSADGLILPVVYLVCNFSAPQADNPALLTHDDVITLFHESGHALHALLSTVDEPSASAFSAVEWDAIELPSQFMENFCWEWPVVQQLSSHVVSAEPLPYALYEKLLAAKNFQSGMQMVRQLEFSLFDMLIHDQPQGLNISEVLKILDTVRKEVAVITPPEWHRFPHAFSHLFAGGYGAGYYSYKWAEVLSSDAYEAFEEDALTSDDGTRDTLVSATGKRFLDEVLAIGGERPAAESFLAFRGREPSIDALLRHSGMHIR